MNIHKRTRLTRIDREQIWALHSAGAHSQQVLADTFRVSRQTVSKIIGRARKQEFVPRSSANQRYRCAEYGIRRLAKIEASIEQKRKQTARRYNKRYPGEMVHFDTKRLPFLEGENARTPREYLFIGIDDFSRELYAAIKPDKTQHSAAEFLEQLVEECPYSVEVAYSDNGTEYKGRSEHAFVSSCAGHGIGQQFTRVRTPRTNGKAERVIRTCMEMWHDKTRFKSRTHRKTELIRFINYYNSVKPHKGIDNQTPMEKLIEYFYPQSM
jgi:transposase InsO family protein